MKSSGRTSFTKTLKRFAVPGFVVTLYYYLKFGAKISPKAEVELSGNLTIGRGSRVSSFTKIKANDGPLNIGRRCGFGTGCFLSSGEAGLIIGDNLVCGPNVVIMASSYRYDQLDVHLHDQGMTSKGTRIGNNVWIGAGAVILDGTVLRDNTVVVANSLVTRSHPAKTILQGNPAKPMRSFHRQ